MWSAAPAPRPCPSATRGARPKRSNAVAVNRNVRMAAIFRNGVVFARFDRQPETRTTPIEAQVSADLRRAPRAAVHLRRRLASAGASDSARRRAASAASIWNRISPGSTNAGDGCSSIIAVGPVRRARHRLRAVVEAAAAISEPILRLTAVTRSSRVTRTTTFGSSKPAATRSGS